MWQAALEAIYDGKELANGYQIALACGPLKKPRHINHAIEKELAEFKEEIKEKFGKSKMNKTYAFPRPLLKAQDNEMESDADENVAMGVA